MAKLRVDKIAAPIVKDEFTGSVYFDGTGDYLSLSSNTDFAMGTGDFTAECFINATSFSNAEGSYSERVFDSNTGQLGIYVTSDGSGTIGALVSGTDHRGNNSPTLSGWTHVALTRSGSTVRIFLNGVLDSSFTNSGSVASSGDFLIGARGSGTGGFLGYISNFRICKGHAVYTGNFTPPTRELEVHTGAKGVVFPAADNRTVLLACQSSTDATAEATGRHIITANGDAHAQSANPGLFRKTNITSTITEDTGSVFFDGTGDYFDIVENNNDFDFDGDFTVEFWVYFNTVNSRNDTVGSGNNSVYLGSSKSGWIASYYTLSGSKWHFSYQSNQSWIFEYTFSFTSVADTWYHVAFTREGSSIKCFVDGVQQGSTQSSSATLTSSENLLRVGGGGGSTSLLLNGYLSNLRICKGHAVYTSQFIPPTRELEVHPETVLLACYDGENIFADKSGRHIIAAYGDRTSSPTPTATDSPIGSTTVTPGLTREVDPTAGPTFQGGAGFVSQNWLTLPKGTTTDRNRTGGRGLIAGGVNVPSAPTTNFNSIEYITISSMGNGQDFGDLINSITSVGSLASSTRGIFAGGLTNPSPITYTNEIQYVTTASTGNAVDFGNLTADRRYMATCSSNTRGVFMGGEEEASPNAPTDDIKFITIATLGDAEEFGDLTDATEIAAGCSSPTRGIIGGGDNPADTNRIEYITIATTGDATNFGDLTDDRTSLCAGSSSTRGIFAGGRNAPTNYNIIDYITITTAGNAQDFGDLIGTTNQAFNIMSNSIRGVRAGGNPNASPAISLNTMEYITIASTGNSQDFGDLIQARREHATCADSHGGIS